MHEPRALSDLQKQFVQAMCEGYSTRQIMTQLNISKSRAYRWRASDQIQDLYRRQMVGRMAAALPRMIDRVEIRAAADDAPLMGLVRAAEFLADRTGLAPQPPEQKPAGALAIQINLGDNGPDASQQRIAELEQRIKELESIPGIATEQST